MDPDSKVMGGAISVYLVVKSHNIAKVVFSMYQIMANKVTFVGFRGGDHPIRPPLDPPLPGVWVPSIEERENYCMAFEYVKTSVDKQKFRKIKSMQRVLVALQ